MRFSSRGAIAPLADLVALDSVRTMAFRAWSIHTQKGCSALRARHQRRRVRKPHPARVAVMPAAVHLQDGHRSHGFMKERITSVL